MRLVWTTLGVAALTLAACGTGEPAATYEDPRTGGGGEARLTIDLASPLAYSTVDQPLQDLQIVATAPEGVERVEVALESGAFEAAEPLAEESWGFQAALLGGENRIVVRAHTPTRHADAEFRLSYVGGAPALRVISPGAGDALGPAGLQVEGVAAAASGKQLVEASLSLDGETWVEVQTDEFGRFSAKIDSPGGGAATLSARAIDDQGGETRVDKALVWDEAPPELTLTEPGEGSVLEDVVVRVAGIASDDRELARVEVQVGDAGWVTTKGTETWETVAALQPGTNLIRARATDLAGNTATTEVEVFRARAVTLRLDETEQLLTLTVDKAGLRELIPDEDAKDIVMVYLDIRGLLEEALKAIQNPVLYNVDTSSWGAAEWNMQRILTMSPDNVDVTGTKMEPMLSLASSIGLPVPQLLTDIANLSSPTSTFLSPKDVAEGVFRNVLAPHPLMVPDPEDGIEKVPVTMYDAFQDLETLGEKLGPAGEHPGVLFDAAPAPVILPTFTMTVTARSNLAMREGLDLSKGKSYLFARRLGEPLLEFDFLNPDWFSVTGLVSEPEVDLNFLVTEAPTFASAGTVKEATPEGEFFKGNGQVWDLPSWTFEHLVADMMFVSSASLYPETDYMRVLSYDVGAVEGAAVVHWDKGWLDVQTAGGIGEPPPPQYWWDAVTELAQVRLHDGGLAEGEADLRMTVNGARVPLTADELIASVRPALQAQSDKLAEVMVGDHTTYASACDLYLTRGEDDALYLYYTAAEDVPGMAYSVAKPGFFADAKLTDKVSSSADGGSGDALHEKVEVSLAGGEVYYVQEADGSVWELTMKEARTAGVKPEVDLVLRPVEGGL